MSDCSSESPNNTGDGQQACNAASYKLAFETPANHLPADPAADVLRIAASTDTAPSRNTELNPGEHIFTTTVDGQSRPYKIYVPQNAQHPLPVVFAADGFTRAGSDPGHQMGVVNRLYEDADKHGYAVVSLIPSMEFHPLKGIGVGAGFTGWNFPNAVTSFDPSHTDDTKYFQAVKQDVGKHIQTDLSRQFCEGFSEGAQFLHHLNEQGQPGTACQREALFAGTVTTKEPPDKPGVSELIVHGAKDPLIPLEGASPSLFTKRGPLIHYFQAVEGGNLGDSVPKELFSRAATANGANPNDAATTRTQYFDKQTVVAPNGVRVMEYTMGAPYDGHSFPGRHVGPPYESADSQANGTPAPHTVFDGPHVAACFFDLEKDPACDSEGIP